MSLSNERSVEQWVRRKAYCAFGLHGYLWLGYLFLVYKFRRRGDYLPVALLAGIGHKVVSMQ